MRLVKHKDSGKYEWLPNIDAHRLANKRLVVLVNDSETLDAHPLEAPKKPTKGDSK